MRPSRSDTPTICLICDAGGIVRFQTPRPADEGGRHERDDDEGLPTPADDGFSSNGSGGASTVAAEVGVPLISTYWFDHLDCDHREVQQVVRRCAAGNRADRLRVWLRIDEHQLIRAELTVTPLTAADDADERLVLVRAEPTPAAPPSRRNGSNGAAEASSRPVRIAAPAAADLLDVALPTPLLRLDTAAGTVLAVNAAFADLLGRSRAACANLPLTELAVPADRRALAEFVAALRSTPADAAALADRSIDVTLPTDDAARDVRARITVTPDPATPGHAAAAGLLLVARDVSSEAQMVQLMARADQLAGVAVRNSAILRTLERAFDQAPVGLSLVARGETLRANAAFEAAVARTPDAADAIAAVDARVRAQHQDVVDYRPFAQVRGFWAGDEQGDVVGTLLLPRDQQAWRRVRALATLTDDESRVALAAVDGDATAPIAPDDDGEARVPAALSTLVAEASLSVVREAVADARERATRVVRAVSLRDGRAAELAAAHAGGEVVLTHLALARPTAAQLDAVRDELAALRAHADAQAAALGAARAEVDAIAGAAEARIARAGADRAAHLDAMLTAIGAGSFTWDVTDGRVVADARARELLSLGDAGDADDAFTQATLLAAARADERQAYERALFDAMSPDGPGTLDVYAHVGPDAHAVRLIGRVIFESGDDAADAEPHDPTRLLAVVLDLRDERAMASELQSLRSAHAAIDGAHATLREAHASVERDLAARELRVAELSGEQASSLARLAAFEASLKAAESSSRTFETNVKSLEANVRTLTRDRASLEADAARRGREKEAIAAELAQVQARAAELDGRRAAIEGERNDAAARLAAIDAERNELRASLAEAERGRAQADATARLRAAELNALVECVPDAVRVRSDGVTRHNAAAALLFGDALAFGLDDAKSAKPSKHAFEIVSLDAKTLPAAAAMAGQAEHATMRLRRDGAPRPIVVHSIAAPVRVDGQTVGAVVVDRDQSEQMHVESQLGRSERAAAAIFQNTGVGVAYLDAAGIVLDANAQTSVLLGFSNADLVGQPLGAVAATPADRATLDGQREAVLSGELASCSAEFQLARRDERPYWVQMTVALGASTGGGHDEPHEDGAPTLVVLIQDVDELRRLRDEQVDAARRLSAAESRRKLIAAAAEDGIVLLDAGGAAVESNAAARRLLGPPDAAASGARFIAGETNEQITASAFWARVARGRPGASEYRVERDGVPTRHVRVSVTPANLIEGVAEAESRLTIVRATDLSSLAAVQEELRQAQGRIVEAHTQMQQRTATLEETFASAVQQLGAAAATAAPSARSLVDDPKLNAEARDASRRVADAIRVHERLVAHFNAAATLGAGAPAAAKGTRLPVDVHALAEEAITLIDERFGAAGRLRRHLDASRAICDVDAALARHGLWSLLAHAASQSPRSRGATAILRSALSSDARKLELSLTWPSSRANTAEIAIARSLLEAAGGTLRVESAGDAETTATIAFALASTSATANAEPARPMVGALLIEDHESTARVLARQLTRLGCDVRHVRDLAEARAALAAKSGNAIDLVVCDLTMPGGDAVAFLGEVTRRRTPAIALRGYEGGPDAEALRGAGVVEQLVKPVDLNALAASIRRLTT